MKVLIIGNYDRDRQQSMRRFAELLTRGIAQSGHEAVEINPPTWLGRLAGGNETLHKWIGYVDRLCLFPPRLRRLSRGFDVVHICDQVNAGYARWLRHMPCVITCHDMLAIRSALGEIPENSTRWTGRVYQRWILSSLRQNRNIVCVSGQTLSELKAHCSADKSTFSVIPNALNYPYRRMESDETAPILGKLGLRDESFVVHVSNNSWYKNRAGVLAIFEALIRDPSFARHKLVIAGAALPDELMEQVDRLGDRIVQVGRVGDEELQALYSGAEFLLFPSLYEGFGWPIIEAQACGCPVVTTDKAPMTEVGGKAAIYIDPQDSEKAARTIAQALPQRDALRREGYRNLQRFSLPEMVRGYLAVYAAAIADFNRDRVA